MRNRWSSSGAQHLHLPAPLGRQLAAHRRVGADQFLLHRLLQCGPAGGVEAAHHGVGEALAELLCADEPPARFHPGIELLEVLLGQLVQGDLPQLRDDMLIDLRLVVGLGSGADLRFHIVLIPEVQPLPEGHLRPDLLCLGAGHRLPELLQLFLALPFRFGQDVLRPGQALFVVADDHPALPAAVLALADGALALFPPLTHGGHLPPACLSATVSGLSPGDLPGSRPRCGWPPAACPASHGCRCPG